MACATSRCCSLSWKRQAAALPGSPANKRQRTEGPAFIEWYPHVALLALLKRDYRVPYEVSRFAKYWKAEKLTRSERIERLLEQFQAIKTGLNKHISGIPDFIPAPLEVSTLASLKPVEDMLDGLICAWIGIKRLEGRTVGLGDDTAAIWVLQQL